MRNKKLYLYILLGALILVSCQEDNDINKSKSCSADKDELNKYEYFNNIKWINRDGVWSLSVSPKRSLRLSVSKDDIKKSWQELKENFPSRAKRKIKQNTIVYSTVRPNQEHYGFFNSIEKENTIVSTGFATIDVFSDNVEPKFLYYLLTQRWVTNYLHTIAENSVSAYPSITPSDIGNLRFEFPDLPKQKKIASILSDTDRKIDLNKQINDNLSYYFIQFLPAHSLA